MKEKDGASPAAVRLAKLKNIFKRGKEGQIEDGSTGSEAESYE